MSAADRPDALIRPDDLIRPDALIRSETMSLLRLLPPVFQRAVQDPNRPPDRVLLALLEVMSVLQRPDQEVLADLDAYFDRYQAPDAFVPLLAGWLDLDWLFTRQPARLDAAAAREISPFEIGRLRELVAAAARLARLRGTAEGLIDFMETATNVTGLAVDDHVPGRSFHLRVWAPPQGEPWRAALARMLAVLKPAYTTAELFTAGDLAGKLGKENRLTGLSIACEVEWGDPRPRRIHLRVTAPGAAPLDPERSEAVARCIGAFTPPGEPVKAGADEKDPGAHTWQKTFHEWHVSETG